jgi:hypothetical protein
MISFRVLYIVVRNNYVEYYLKELSFSESNNVSEYIEEDTVISQNLCEVSSKLLLKHIKYDVTNDDLEDVLTHDYKVDKVVHVTRDCLK